MLTSSVVIELLCPIHGFERFKIKIIKKHNVPSHMILLKFRNKSGSIEPSLLVVGKKVSLYDIEKCLTNYLQDVGLWNIIINMRFTR